jgi:hypothetical protein
MEQHAYSYSGPRYGCNRSRGTFFWMYVCMYVCMCVCMHVRIVCTNLDIFCGIHVCVVVCLLVCMYHVVYASLTNHVVYESIWSNSHDDSYPITRYKHRCGQIHTMIAIQSRGICIYMVVSYFKLISAAHTASKACLDIQQVYIRATYTLN